MGDVTPVQYVLVDRQNCRRKFDSYHKHEGHKFRRLLLDIEHLSLGNTYILVLLIYFLIYLIILIVWVGHRFVLCLS